jgi:hypothetical protein
MDIQAQIFILTPWLANIQTSITFFFVSLTSKDGLNIIKVSKSHFSTEDRKSFDRVKFKERAHKQQLLI